MTQPVKPPLQKTFSVQSNIKMYSFIFKIPILFTLLIFSSNYCLLYAQNINISASVNKNVVALDEQLELTINISGDVSNIPNAQIPSLPNFTAYSSGRSQNISIINGKASSTVTFTYVLVPKNIGNFTLPPLILEYSGKTYKTQPINIKVVAQGQAPKTQTPKQAPKQISGKGQEGLFITADVDKKTVYVNEQLTYIFRFYRRVRLLSNPNYSPPDFSGFWTEELPPQNFNSTVDGQNYLVSEVKTILFPTTSGKFTLGRASLQCRVEDFNPNDFFADGFFSSFFSGGKTQVLITNPITINVKPLPETGKPKTFNGAVGQYKISAEIDKKTVKVNDPVTLSLTVSGTGNIKTISEPKLPEWPDFRKYETVSSLNVQKDEGIIKGSKTFKTVIVPQTPGHKTILKIEFSFFDPKQKKYRTVSTPQLSLEVKPGPSGSAAGSYGGKDDSIKVISQDINFIKSISKWDTYRGPIYNKNWFIIINIFPIFLFGLVFSYKRWQEKLSTDIAFARRIRASSSAKKYLKQAKALLKIEKSLDFYCTLSRSLLKYIADKTNVSSEGLTTNQISDLLNKRNINDDFIIKIKDMLAECDMVRFAPTSVNEEMMKKAYSQVEYIISYLERELKKSK